jgi:hypothetical protein
LALSLNQNRYFAETYFIIALRADSHGTNKSLKRYAQRQHGTLRVPASVCIRLARNYLHILSTINLNRAKLWHL